MKDGAFDAALLCGHAIRRPANVQSMYTRLLIKIKGAFGPHSLLPTSPLFFNR
jgi:hypothetical protein